MLICERKVSFQIELFFLALHKNIGYPNIHLLELLMKFANIFPFLFLLIGLYTESFGNEFYWANVVIKDTKFREKEHFFNGKLTSTVLDTLAKRYKNTPNDFLFFNRANILLAFQPCGFDLFEVNGSQLTQKYKFYNRGYTCGAVPFVRDSVIYLLGSDGLWNSTSDLIRFDELNGSWELSVTQNQPVDYHTEVVFQNSKGVYALFGFYMNPRKKLIQAEFDGYFLDWQTKEWKRLRVNIAGNGKKQLTEKSTFASVETKNYLFFFLREDFDVENIGWNIVDKETGEIYLYDGLINDYVSDSPYIEVINDVIRLQMPDGIEKTLDMAAMRKKSKKVGQLELGNPEEPVRVSSKEMGYLFFVLVLISGIGLVLYKRTNVKNELEEELLAGTGKDTTIFIEQLLLFSGQQLDTEQFDKLIDVESIENLDSKRIKRARTITKINEAYYEKEGKYLIIREKNPDDKRFVSYRIDR